MLVRYLVEESKKAGFSLAKKEEFISMLKKNGFYAKSHRARELKLDRKQEEE